MSDKEYFAAWNSANKRIKDLENELSMRCVEEIRLNEEVERLETKCVALESQRGAYVYLSAENVRLRDICGQTNYGREALNLLDRKAKDGTR